MIYQSYIALCEIRYRTVTGVRTVAARTTIRALVHGAEFGRSTVSGDSAGDFENLTQTHDMLFCLHLCVSLHYMCIGAPKSQCLPSVIPE